MTKEDGPMAQWMMLVSATLRVWVQVMILERKKIIKKKKKR